MTAAEQSRFNLDLADLFDATDVAVEDSEDGLVDAFLEMTPDEQQFASEFVSFLATGRFSDVSATAAAPCRPR